MAQGMVLLQRAVDSVLQLGRQVGVQSDSSRQHLAYNAGRTKSEEICRNRAGNS
jgi:hypothetical protein